MSRQKTLFICVHNSARSQMAEAWLNHICGDYFEGRSAGLEPGTMNPIVVEVMKEAGIDLSEKKTQAVFDVWKSGQMFQYAITVCSEGESDTGWDGVAIPYPRVSAHGVVNVRDSQCLHRSTRERDHRRYRGRIGYRA
ncbi:MAG: arsenate reductase ArsC [Chthoniobacterales bacterium]